MTYSEQWLAGRDEYWRAMLPHITSEDEGDAWLFSFNNHVDGLMQVRHPKSSELTAEEAMNVAAMAFLIQTAAYTHHCDEVEKTRRARNKVLYPIRRRDA